MNHKEILSALLMGDTLKMTSMVSACPDSNVPAPFIFFVKLIGDQLFQRYNYDESEFRPVDNSVMLFSYKAEIHQSGPTHFRVPETDSTHPDMPRASAYTDGKEIRLFFGSADEISIDAFHKMKRISPFQISTTY